MCIRDSRRFGGLVCRFAKLSSDCGHLRLVWVRPHRRKTRLKSGRLDGATRAPAPAYRCVPYGHVHCNGKGISRAIHHDARLRPSIRSYVEHTRPASKILGLRTTRLSVSHSRLVSGGARKLTICSLAGNLFQMNLECSHGSISSRSRLSSLRTF